jgi:hypothetical protein
LILAMSLNHKTLLDPVSNGMEESIDPRLEVTAGAGVFMYGVGSGTRKSKSGII